MAVFLPALARTSPRSSGEAKVLSWLARLEDDWYVLHSVGVLEHATKAWAEADVVVVGPPGVLVLEVKGGRVERTRGLWTFTDRAGAVHRRPEGPFDQAGGASSALHRALLKFGALTPDQVMGYGVAFPDAELRGVDASDVLEQVMLDVEDDWTNPRRTLTNWLNYWRRRQGFSKGCDRASRDEVVRVLRGDLSFPERLARRIDSVLAQQRAETARQLDICRAIFANPRAVVRCPPASGGHLLALQTFLELAARAPEMDLRVTDPGLAHWAEELLGTVSDTSSEPSAVSSEDLDPDLIVLSNATEPAPSETVHPPTGNHDRWIHFIVDQLVDDRHDPPLGTTVISTTSCRTTKEIAVFGSMLARRTIEIGRLPAGPPVRTKWYDTSKEAVRVVGEIVAELAQELDQEQLLVLLGRQGASLRDDIRSVLPPGYESVPVLDASDRSVPEADAVVTVLDAPDQDEAYLLPALLRARAVLRPVLHVQLRETFEQGGAWYGERMRQRRGGPALLPSI